MTLELSLHFVSGIEGEVKTLPLNLDSPASTSDVFGIFEEYDIPLMYVYGEEVLGKLFWISVMLRNVPVWVAFRNGFKPY